MSSGIYFVSSDPIRRRMSQSVNSASPGFTAIICNVDRSKNTIDVYVQGSDKILKGIPYSTTNKETLRCIRVRQPVYIRHMRGNKFQVEMAGASHIIPTVTANSPSPLPPLPALEDTVISGLNVVQCATPYTDGKPRVAVMTGSVRFSGVVYTLSSIYLNQNVSALRTGGSSSSDGNVMKLGWGQSLGYTYLWLRLNNSHATLHRYDQIEIGSDRVIDVVTGTAAAVPSTQTPQAGHLLLAAVLVRAGADQIVSADINAVYTTGQTLTAIPAESILLDTDTTCYITAKLVDQSNKPVVGAKIYYQFFNGADTINSGAFNALNDITDAAGCAYFSFTKVTTPTKSAQIKLFTVSGIPAWCSILIKDATGIPLPY